MQIKQAIKDIDKVNNFTISDTDANTDIDGANNQGTSTEGATNSNGNDNNKVRHLKIVIFFINNITD